MITSFLNRKPQYINNKVTSKLFAIYVILNIGSASAFEPGFDFSIEPLSYTMFEQIKQYIRDTRSAKYYGKTIGSILFVYAKGDRSCNNGNCQTFIFEIDEVKMDLKSAREPINFIGMITSNGRAAVVARIFNRTSFMYGYNGEFGLLQSCFSYDHALKKISSVTIDCR
jgi:hypothetical protein